MPLDFSRLTVQIAELAGKARAGQADFSARLETALATVQRSREGVAALGERIETHRGRYTWLAAGLGSVRDALEAAYDPPPLPEDRSVVATDGSQIDVDRQAPAPWYLLNMGTVSLQYGSQPEARLESRPRVYGRPEDLVLSNPQNRVQQETVEGSLLGYRRTVDEVWALVEAVRELPEDLPAIGILDGSLVLWGLAGQGHGEYVRRALVTKGLVAALEALRQEAERRPLAVASYISLPQATEVVGALRLALCPFDAPDCDRNCRAVMPLERGCDGVARVLDRHLFERLLEPGQRSAMFTSRSSIVDDYYGGHQVRFFYLYTGSEVARVELPRWVEEGEQVGLLHALLNEQVRLGRGYPLSLAEAHEQAVVRTADRDVFWQLVDAEMRGRQVLGARSEKARAKGRRWV